MHDYLADSKTDQIALPYWNSIERKISDLAKSTDEEFDINIIPLWLESDFNNGNIT